ncbi:MAG: DNA/RNA non-specific endonuclease [Bacteroidaceae bacterium]|nr:DNA/RNA non-specific endonuclease [Bacteroidaceae bacterium]
MANGKQNSRMAWILIACVCVFGAFYLGSIVKNCSRVETPKTEKWGSKNADDSYVTGGTAEGTKSVSDGDAYVPERPEREASYDAEAPSEGLSQTVFESLEQPAPITNRPEAILCKSAFIVSFNISTLCPNYVAWHLTAARTEGDVKRSDEYIEDMVLAEGSRVMASDYSGSGYDRGHMCPAGDNKNDERAMAESFMMTNICPQAHKLNSDWWNDLEIKCREWANRKGDLYIVAGPIFDTPSPKKIGRRKNVRISVPDRFFKVILMMGDDPKAIGFIVPNLDLNDDLAKYAVSVDKVEQVTGFDFYPNLPDGMERRLERECKPEKWGL